MNEFISKLKEYIENKEGILIVSKPKQRLGMSVYAMRLQEHFNKYFKELN